MTEIKKLIEFLGDTLDYLGLYSPDKNGMIRTGFTLNQIAMLTEIKGILISYPIILKGLKEANKNIDNFIKSKQPTEVPDDLVEKIMDDVIKFAKSYSGLPERKEEEALAEIRKLLQQAQPDEEFIQNTYDEIYTHITYDIDMRISIDEDEVKNIIRKLLQSRQPGKPKITRGEIELCFRTSDYKTISDPIDIRNRMIMLFKSKGVEVSDK